MFSLSTLPNGLRMLTAPSTGTEAATVIVFVKVGSRYETHDVIGGSHFLEHMMFKGTKKHPTAHDISKLLDTYGADYNAFTAKDHTAYYVKISSENLHVGIKLLHDMLFNSKNTQVELEREKRVIVEEINMYEDNPRMLIGDLLENAMFSGTTLGRKIAGHAEDVLRTRRTDLLGYREKFYIPGRMVVTLAGKFTAADERLARKLFGSVRKGKRCDYAFSPLVLAKRDELPVGRQEKRTEQVQLALGFLGLPYGAHDLPAMKLLSVILGGGMSSRLFIAVRERRGLAYSVHASVGSYEDTGSFDITAGLAKGKLKLAVKTIMQVLTQMKRKGPTAQELRDAKTQLAGKRKLHLEDCAERAEWYGRQALFQPNDVKTPEERLREINAVSQADVTRVAREVLDQKRMSVGIIGPFTSDAEVRKLFS